MNTVTTHQLDQYLALSLDVHVRLRRHYVALVEEGWSQSEAWALCQKVEERLLGPALDRMSRHG